MGPPCALLVEKPIKSDFSFEYKSQEQRYTMNGDNHKEILENHELRPATGVVNPCS